MKDQVKMNSYSESATAVTKTTPQQQVEYAVDYVNRCFEALEYLTKKVEPILLPQVNEVGAALKELDRARESTLVMDIQSLNSSLYHFLNRLQELPNLIQL